MIVLVEAEATEIVDEEVVEVEEVVVDVVGVVLVEDMVEAGVLVDVAVVLNVVVVEVKFCPAPNLVPKPPTFLQNDL